MAVDCNSLLAKLNPGCDAIKAIGGVKEYFWLSESSSIDTIAFDSDGGISTFTLADGRPLRKVEGMKLTHGGTTDYAPGDNVGTFSHATALRLYHSTQAERTAIEGFCDTEDLIVFFETNKGQIEAYGISNKDYMDHGMKCSSAPGGTGVATQDPHFVTMNHEGEFRNLPPRYKTTRTLSENRTELNNLTLIPVVSSISPTTYTAAGGGVVTITGENFLGVTTVNFVDPTGSATAASVVTVNSETEIDATIAAAALTAGVTYGVRVEHTTYGNSDIETEIAMT